MATVLQYPIDYYVWVDECGSDHRNQIRRFGYAQIGEDAVYQGFLSRGTRYSTIAAISSLGLVDYVVKTGSINGDIFYDFVRGYVTTNVTLYRKIELHVANIIIDCEYFYRLYHFFLQNFFCQM